MCDIRVQHTPSCAPRARRWKVKKTHPGGVVEYTRLDALTVDDAIWTPYTNHRVHCEFDESSLFFGYMRWEILVTKH